jgi:ribosomal protein S18 acetylase RimI-like enzyme
MNHHIRPAIPSDVDVLHRFIVELAETEEFPGEVTARPADLGQALFGPQPRAEAVVAIVREQPAGFALFYSTYSTIVGRPGIHLEDLYIRPEYRGDGLGQELFGHLARLTLERGGARLEWSVLHTNVAALRFYRRLRARAVDEIAIMRIDGETLAALAKSDNRTEPTLGT